MFVIAFPGLFPSQLAFELVDGNIDALVGIDAWLGSDEDVAVLASCNYLDTDVAPAAAVDYHLNLIDAVVVLWKLGSLFLCVSLEGLRYVDMLTGNCEKQS
jgi:hypothetical protein